MAEVKPAPSHPDLSQPDLSQDARRPWLEFFLACANEVSPSFRIGAPPKMSYIPIQLENASKNAISVWNDEAGVKVAFSVPELLDFQAALEATELNWDYQQQPHHLNVFLPPQPTEALCTLLKPFAAKAAAGVLPGSGE